MMVIALWLALSLACLALAGHTPHCRAPVVYRHFFFWGACEGNFFVLISLEVSSGSVRARCWGVFSLFWVTLVTKFEGDKTLNREPLKLVRTSNWGSNSVDDQKEFKYRQ